MDEFISKAKKFIDKTATHVTVRSTTLLETTKLKQEILLLKKEKKKTFYKIGEEIYNMNKVGDEDMPTIDIMVAKVSEIDEKISDLKIKIEEAIKNQEEKIKATEEAQEAEAEQTKGTPVYETEPEVNDFDIADGIEVIDNDNNSSEEA